MTDKTKTAASIKDKKLFHVKKEVIDVEQVKAAFAFGRGSILKDKILKEVNHDHSEEAEHD